MRNSIFLILVIVVGINCTKAQNTEYIKTGVASFYADKFEGRTTANGEVYYHPKKTAAHRSLPFGSIVKVTNLENNKYVVVRINDRGPFVSNRIIDLSKSAAHELGFIGKGLANVKIELIASVNDLPQGNEQITEKQVSAEYYKLDVYRTNPKGKGIQIGSFKEDENVFRLAERLKSKYNVDVYIQLVNLNDQKLYRVILGNYTTSAYLEKLKTQLSKEYPDCFVVTFK